MKIFFQLIQQSQGYSMEPPQDEIALHHLTLVPTLPCPPFLKQNPLLHSHSVLPAALLLQLEWLWMQLTHFVLLQDLFLWDLCRPLLHLNGLQVQETSLSLQEMILKSSPSRRCFQSCLPTTNRIQESVDGLGQRLCPVDASAICGR